MEPLTEFNQLLQRWQDEIFEHPGTDPKPLLAKMAKLIEDQTKEYLKMPIDPFDTRHPSRTNPTCSLGQILKALFRDDNFMSALTNDYISARSAEDLQTVGCRLLLDVLPGLEAAVVFNESPELVKNILKWSGENRAPLNAYATGLLAAAMEDGEISSKYRADNNQLVTIMLDRLRGLTPTTANDDQPPSSSSTSTTTTSTMKRPFDDDSQESRKSQRVNSSDFVRSPLFNECSNSSWAETHLTGSYQMDPPDDIMKQRFILQYLTTLGYYQDMLVHMFEQKALSYILYFIDYSKNQDIRLAFDALRFLASLLMHKKFALEFLNHGGLQQLVKVNRQAMASSGVGYCLYCLATNEDVLERICWMPHPENGTPAAEEMVKYGLWLLEGSHNFSRDHAAVFFSLCFRFPMLLKLFDNDNGLRKLLNVVFVNGLFSDDPTMDQLSEDELFSRRQTARNVCLTLKTYARAHFIKETLRMTRRNGQSERDCKALGISDESVIQYVELHRQGSITRHNWRALDKLVQEDGIGYILRLIAHYSDENILFTAKGETVRNALEVLLVCSLAPKVQSFLLKETIRIEREDPEPVAVLKVIVTCADPKKMSASDPKEVDCLKSALHILINLVSSNLTRPPNPATTNGRPNISISTPTSSAKLTPGSSKKRSAVRNLTDYSGQLRNAIWKNCGTMILPKLLKCHTKSVTDADLIRSLACRVLCSLAREERIRQILSKSPLFLDGELLTLMKEPILQEKRSEHASFCQFGKELIEVVTRTSLDYIITQYSRSLRGRLLAPHNCPEPSNRLMAPYNIASRIRQRQIYPPWGGMNGTKYDRQYIYSKFRPLKLVRDSIEARANNSTCCAFSYVDHFLFVGTQNGLLKAFNVNTGVVEASYDCHNGPLGYIGPSKDGSLIITTSPVTATPVCLLWTFTDLFERKLKFDNDIHAEFGKTSSERVISSQELYARLWDVTTGQMLFKYKCHHKYLSNRATMSYDDDLVLNDGTLWDVRSGSIIHEFDQNNERISGIFHPNGNEIISNSHIWDLRNFRLLKQVHAFDECQLVFNSTGDVIFSTSLDDQMEEQPMPRNEFKTSFRTFDSHDYSTIATIDLKRTISDLAVNPTDEYIALIESSGNLRYSDYMMESNLCRIYEIGRSRYREDIDMADDDQDEDEDEDVDDEDDDEDDDDEEDDDDIGHLEFEDEEFMDTEEENEDSDISSDVNSGSEDELAAPFRFGASDNPDLHADRDPYGDDDDDEYEDIEEI